MSTYLLKDLVNKISKLGDRLHLNRDDDVGRKVCRELDEDVGGGGAATGDVVRAALPVRVPRDYGERGCCGGACQGGREEKNGGEEES